MSKTLSVFRTFLVFAFAVVLLQLQPLQANAMEQVDSTDVVKLIGSGKGKVTIVNFWASWCPPCREEMPDLRKTKSAYSDDQLLLLGISVDENKAAAEGIVKEFDLNYPVYLAQPDVYETFGIQSIPRLLVYDTNGKLVVDHVGAVTYEDLKKLIDELLKDKK